MTLTVTANESGMRLDAFIASGGELFIGNLARDLNTPLVYCANNGIPRFARNGGKV